jgi:hypothetical protein
MRMRVIIHFAVPPRLLVWGSIAVVALLSW